MKGNFPEPVGGSRGGLKTVGDLFETAGVRSSGHLAVRQGAARSED
jgi:hypothetical protein